MPSSQSPGLNQVRPHNPYTFCLLSVTDTNSVSGSKYTYCYHHCPHRHVSVSSCCITKSQGRTITSTYFASGQGSSDPHVFTLRPRLKGKQVASQGKLFSW